MSSFDPANLLNLPSLNKHIELVDTQLVKALDTDNQYIKKPLTRILSAKSKRLRPSLVIAVTASQGGRINSKVISCCVAIELLHLATLVHDDIIDEAEVRRGVPTINYKEGTNRAILVGDYIAAIAIEVAASHSAEAAAVVARAYSDVCLGQASELADEFNVNRRLESMLSSINGKTAALMSAACELGGICASLSTREIKALATFGENFGMAFQLIDDVLDYVSNSKLLGKAVCTDINEGIYTMPLLLTLAGPESKDLKAMLASSKKIYPSEITRLMILNGSFKQTINEARNYGRTSSRALNNLHLKNKRVELVNLPDNYLNWALANLVDSKYKSKF